MNCHNIQGVPLCWPIRLHLCRRIRTFRIPLLRPFVQLAEPIAIKKAVFSISLWNKHGVSLLYDFFARAGRDKIGENGIAVAGKTDLTSRDNLLTIQFEYRNGMDVTFRMMHTIPLEEPTIESVSINGKWNIKK